MAIKTQLLRTLYRLLGRPCFFLIDPETIHDLITRLGYGLGSNQMLRSLTKWSFDYQHPSLEQTVCGMRFRNPIGLSAGFDKDANLVQVLPAVGFGYMQVGTVTADPYKGNPKPRLYRLPKSQALVVYYGLKNIGAKKIIEKMKKYQVKRFPLSISIGKTNSSKTAKQKAGINDYFECLEMFAKAEIGDFYTINISCPNTFGGEPFTTPESLESLLKKLTSLKINRPVFLKMPINLPWPKFKKLVDVAVKYKIDGVIIGNLNKNHGDKTVMDAIPERVKGGISGKPTWKLSNELISQTYKHYGKRLTIIGVGGIFSAEDAYEKIRRGSSLVQLITGMIYQGPQLIGEINQGLVELLTNDGYENIHQAIGADYRK